MNPLQKPLFCTNMKSSDTVSIIESARRTLQMEGDSVLALLDRLDSDFEQSAELIHNSSGRLVITGIGKSAIIAQKLVATMNSTGTPALYMHAADAIHGDLGMVQPDDVVLCISKSGNSPEIKVLSPLIKRRGNVLIGMVGNRDSHLAQHSDLILDSTVEQEACPHNLAPTTSTTAQLALGDALAVCLLQMSGFKAEDFAKSHPGGQLGKQLYTTLSDLAELNAKPSVRPTDSLKEVIYQISQGRLGAVVVSEEEQILGIITDGDIRRMLESGVDIAKANASSIMTPKPFVISGDTLASKGAEAIKTRKINHLILEVDDRYTGLVHLQDLAREGFL
jgi:arabinose-5-phosphate isomerase